MSHDRSKVEDDVKGPLRDRVMDKFDIDMHLLHVKYVVDKILGERLRGFRCILNSHYKKFKNDEVARRHPYGGKEEFKRVSETQQPIGMIELYRRTHFSRKGWTSLVAEENYVNGSEAEGVVPKIEDEILNTVLGIRSGYFKGLGQRRRDEEEFQRRRAEPAEKRNEELTAEMTHVMGVLNLTPDSFSDGGKFQSIKAAVSQVKLMISEGVDIIDIGAQFTRPFASRISAKEELERQIPVLEAVLEIPEIEGKFVSVDTFYSKVAFEAINKGAHIINDVSGGQLDPDMFKVSSDLGILML
ncbi:hypothetical protein GIB67_005688 [Kingdonia uniflora]|uniref:Pterin-binding domain-containing protein n=1 Tax=Kingdonia uniflora TaxID=39325 RepID=A0A7J7NIK7_9MAGN|nr:hypothetical protein GIB67_005688 [Kingdonia uniflora]